jgi:hypothetical protein
LAAGGDEPSLVFGNRQLADGFHVLAGYWEKRNGQVPYPAFAPSTNPRTSAAGSEYASPSADSTAAMYSSAQPGKS